MAEDIIPLDQIQAKHLTQIEVDDYRLLSIRDENRLPLNEGSKVLLTDHPIKPFVKSVKIDRGYLLKFEPNPLVDYSMAPARVIAEHARLRLKEISAPITAERMQAPPPPPPYRPEPVKKDVPEVTWHFELRDPLGFADQNPYLFVQVENIETGEKVSDDARAYLRVPPKSLVKGKQMRVTFFPETPAKGQGQLSPIYGGYSRASLIDGGRFDFTEKDHYQLKFAAYPALILSPSLTTPALVPQGEDLQVILAVPEKMHKAIQSENLEADNSLGPISLFRFYSQLLVFPYNRPEYLRIDKKNIRTLRSYPTFEQAREQMQAEFLSAIDDLDDSGDSGWSLSRQNGELLGILAWSTKEKLKAEGFSHLYSIRFSKLGFEKGFYNLKWFNLKDDCHVSHCATNLIPAQHKNTEEALIKTRMDAEIKKGGKKPPKEGRQPIRYYLYQPNRDLDNGFIGKGKDPDALQPYHPLFISNKPKLLVGQISDVHISSRQHILAHSQAQVIPGASEAHSPKLGQYCQRNLASLKRLLDKMGQDPEIDLVLCTGDIQDHSINADPAHPDHQNLNTPGQIWRAMHHHNHTDRQKYPRNIDALMMLSLIIQFMRQYQKPFLFIDGNHEAYDSPYGISPRIKAGPFGTIHGAKANAGIPADHNLSLQEAGLVYGYDYAYYEKTHNFTAKNQQWVRQFFSPFKDWIIQYGKRQTLIGLGWGEDEAFMEPTLVGGGSLPRSVQACSDKQLQLIETAVNLGAEQTLMLSHFTMLNYATHLPLKQQGTTDITSVGWTSDTFGADQDNYEEGSFYKNRERLYKDYLWPGKIHYSFAGHSHRAGVYHLTCQPDFLNDMKTQGYYPDGYQNPKQSACLIVSGSGGPLSKQNLYGEYAGEGTEPPQGLKLNTETGKIQLIRDPVIKPRMAVLMEYLWYNQGLALLSEQRPLIVDLGKKTGYLSLTEKWLEASTQGQSIIEKLALHLHQGGEQGYQGYISLKNTSSLASKAPLINFQITDEGLGSSGYIKTLKKAQEGIKPVEFYYFLSIHFRHRIKGLSHDQYDYQSPWCFAVRCQQQNGRLSLTRIGDMPEFNAKPFSTQFGKIYDFDKKEIKG